MPADLTERLGAHTAEDPSLQIRGSGMIGTACLHSLLRYRLSRRRLLAAGGALTANVLVGWSRSEVRAGTVEETPCPATVENLAASLPRTAALIEADRARGGAGQLYVSRNGACIADLGWGRTGRGAAITADSLVPWASAVKPTTCAAVLRLADAGVLGIDDPVTRFIPEFGVHGKEAVTVRHLLTHTAYLGGYDGPALAARESWDETVTKIIRAPRESPEATRRRIAQRMGQTVPNEPDEAPPPPPPGTIPAYNPAGIWILGEILRRIHGRPFAEVIRTEVYQPCGMDDSWCGLSAEQFQKYGDRIVSGVGRITAPSVQPDTAANANPAGGGVGPARELGRFYEMLLRGGTTIRGMPLLRAETVAEMTRLQATDGGIWVWGLGLSLNLTAEGLTADADLTVADPTGLRLRYGRHASPQTYGHNGATGMIAFADPRDGLVVSMIGLPASAADAIYEDLGLVP
jgi:CubicO group peptidase (beta-lactamase class C family)